MITYQHMKVHNNKLKNAKRKFIFIVQTYYYYYYCCYSLRERLHAHKAVPYLGRSFLYFIDFIHAFHVQIINFE